TGDTFEDVPIVFVQRDFLALTIRAFEMLSNAPAAILIDPPGELIPKFVLFPDRARIGLVSELDRLAFALAGHTEYGLSKRDPGAAIGLVTIEIVTLRAMAHGQDKIGPVSGFVPGRRQGHVEADLLLTGEHLDPAKAIGVSPDGIEDACEIDI